jgi:flagellar biosynthesis/type III secretory pathway chaperone
MGEIEGLFSDLINNLGKQCETYSELSTLADSKRDILIKGDVKLLEDITNIEQKLILKLGRMEDERNGIIGRIANDCRKDVAEVNVGFLEGIAPDEKAVALRKQKERLEGVLLELSEKNKINESLINKALEYIQFSLRVITEAGRQETGYNASGSSEKKSMNFIDRKA